MAKGTSGAGKSAGNRGAKKIVRYLVSEYCVQKILAKLDGREFVDEFDIRICRKFVVRGRVGKR